MKKYLFVQYMKEHTAKQLLWKLLQKIFWYTI